MSDETFAITLQHRPRRVAFLVDLNHGEVDRILEGILRFNLDSWGGRHNPIIPLVDGRIPEPYHALLGVADPDVFYTYCDLEPTELEGIHTRYSPTFVTQHAVRPPIDPRSYFVRLPEQATIDKYLKNLNEKPPLHFRHPEPCVLQLQVAAWASLSPFFLWNFGYSELNFFAIQNHGVPGVAPKSTSDADLLELFEKQRNLAWPIHVCSDAPLSRTANDPWRHYLPIFYGESAWNVVAYWNDALTTGPSNSPVLSGIAQLWITKQNLDDQAKYDHLLRLLGHRVYSGNHQKGIRIISYDKDTTELEQIGKRIVKDLRSNLYFDGCVKVEPSRLDAIVPQPFRSFVSPSKDVEYVTGKEIHVVIRKPRDIEENSDQCWMVDVHIYNPDQELWYSNAEPWWRLPRKSSLAGLFTRSRPQRIIFDSRVSFEVGAREATLDFEIPDNGRVFRYLLSSDVHYHLAADLRSDIRNSRSYEIRLSDKGRYLSGILALSGSLKETLYLFEHPFWRSLVQKLSRRAPSKQLTDKLASDIQAFLRTEGSGDKTTTESWLSRELILVGRHLSKTPIWLGFREIEGLYSAYMDQLPEEEKNLLGRKDLKVDLSELTQSNVLFQGAELRCPNCISSYWYAVQEMSKVLSCRGCQVGFPLPAETAWSYQLNDLVKSGIGDQGLLPVLRTLARLFDDARDCFFFTPSVEFIVYPDNEEPKLEREVDIAWIKDGLFGVAEIKTNTKFFQRSDYERLATLAREVDPDILLIAAPEGNEDDLSRGKRAIEERLEIKPDIWTWGPETFKKSPHWTRW